MENFHNPKQGMTVQNNIAKKNFEKEKITIFEKFKKSTLKWQLV